MDVSKLTVTGNGWVIVVVVLQLLMLQPSVVRQDTDPPSLKALVTDPYIIVAAGKCDLNYT